MHKGGEKFTKTMLFLWPDSTQGGFYNEHVRPERKPLALKPGFLRRAQIFCSPHDVTGSIVFMNLDVRKKRVNFRYWIQEHFNNPGFERDKFHARTLLPSRVISP